MNAKPIKPAPCPGCGRQIMVVDGKFIVHDLGLVQAVDCPMSGKPAQEGRSE